MAKRPTPIPEPQRAVLSIEQMQSGIRRIQKRIEQLEAFDLQSVTKRNDPEIKRLVAAVDEALIAVFGHNTIEYDRYCRAKRLDIGPITVGYVASPREVQQYLAEGIKTSITLLKQAITWLEEELAEQEHHAAPSSPTPEAKALVRKVFIVHGHDDAAKEGVARFLEKIGFDAVILHERPNKGRTIVTKFREEAADIGFAVVLMTPDDHGGKAGCETSPRARQNVVFELGFFIGMLGPARVAALVKGELETPSDFDGVVYIPLDNGDWKSALGQELQAAGYEIDWNQVMRG
jgi:predicted nucleotide-binding protein